MARNPSSARRAFQLMGDCRAGLPNLCLMYINNLDSSRVSGVLKFVDDTIQVQVEKSKSLLSATAEFGSYQEP